MAKEVRKLRTIQYIDAHNQNPKVFVWTASVEKIMTKIAKSKEALETLHYRIPGLYKNIYIPGNGTETIITEQNRADTRPIPF